MSVNEAFLDRPTTAKAFTSWLTETVQAEAQFTEGMAAEGGNNGVLGDYIADLARVLQGILTGEVELTNGPS